MRKKVSKAQSIFAGILIISIGFVLLHHHTVGLKVPTRETLTKHSGSIQWIKEDRGNRDRERLKGIEFILSGSNRIFYYGSNDVYWAYRGLKSAQNQKVVTVLYGSNVRAPFLSNRYTYGIYELSIPEYGERTYSQFKSSYEKDSKLGVIVGYGFIGIGIIVIATHRLRS
jgi:hypothetical protein